MTNGARPRHLSQPNQRANQLPTRPGSPIQLGMPRFSLSHPHIHSQPAYTMGYIRNNTKQKNSTNLDTEYLVLSFALLFLREHSELYFPQLSFAHRFSFPSRPHHMYVFTSWPHTHMHTKYVWVWVESRLGYLVVSRLSRLGELVCS